MTKTENDLFVPGFVLPEHRGGDGWTILHGDALDIIPHFQPGAFDAVITACADPAREGGWIRRDVKAAYQRLHELGWAHSLEAWSVAADAPDVP